MPTNEKSPRKNLANKLVGNLHSFFPVVSYGPSKFALMSWTTILSDGNVGTGDWKGEGGTADITPPLCRDVNYARFYLVFLSYVQVTVKSLNSKICFCFLSLSAATQTFYCKPLGGLYCLPYLVDQLNENSGMLSRAEWWELLFFIKKLEQHEQQEIIRFIQENHEEQVNRTNLTWEEENRGRNRHLVRKN